MGNSVLTVSMILSLLLLYIGTESLAKPQYGGVQEVVKAPVIQQPQKVQCTTTYVEVWDTNYIEKIEQQCKTVSETLYRNKCDTVYDTQCNTVTERVCTQKFRQETNPYTETECDTQYKKDCESRWEEDSYGGKKWVEIPSTCQQNKYDTCRDVAKQQTIQVPYQDCQNVPRKQCNQVARQECRNEPYQQPRQVCEDIHRKIPQRVSKRVPKKTCGGGSGNLGSGGSGGSFLPERQGDRDPGTRSSDKINFGK